MVIRSGKGWRIARQQYREISIAPEPFRDRQVYDHVKRLPSRIFPRALSAPEIDARTDRGCDEQRHQHGVLVKQIKKVAHALRCTSIIRPHFFS